MVLKPLRIWGACLTHIVPPVVSQTPPRVHSRVPPRGTGLPLRVQQHPRAVLGNVHIVYFPKSTYNTGGGGSPGS